MVNVTRLLLAAATMIAPACASGRHGTTGTRPSAGEGLATATQGLCEARDLAGAGDVPGASREFQDRVHAYLHDLAARLSTFDREAAGQLLVAKQRLEEALRGSSPDAGEVGALIADLQRELAEAADAAGLPPAPCTEGEAA